MAITNVDNPFNDTMLKFAADASNFQNLKNLEKTLIAYVSQQPNDKAAAEALAALKFAQHETSIHGSLTTIPALSTPQIIAFENVINKIEAFSRFHHHLQTLAAFKIVFEQYADKNKFNPIVNNKIAFIKNKLPLINSLLDSLKNTKTNYAASSKELEKMIDNLVSDQKQLSNTTIKRKISDLAISTIYRINNALGVTNKMLGERPGTLTTAMNMILDKQEMDQQKNSPTFISNDLLKSDATKKVFFAANAEEFKVQKRVPLDSDFEMAALPTDVPELKLTFPSDLQNNTQGPSADGSELDPDPGTRPTPRRP